ncbi:hypothetical protein M9434_007167 [Picochlorum sp. BPE23]|nr:hypothetical protein M9434_007167 [Picochlorum sp. BPE23]
MRVTAKCFSLGSSREDTLMLSSRRINVAANFRRGRQLQRPKISYRNWHSFCLTRATKPEETEADGPNRLANILKMYSKEDLETQKEELEARQSRKRDKQASRGSRRQEPKISFVEGQEEEERKFRKYFYRVEDGTWRPRVGVHGDDVPCWWALRVTIGREKQTCAAIERRYQQLREALEDPDGMQEIETWDISKRVRAWSPKTEKMGNKLIRYDGGGWVMLRANLDSHIAGILRGNINILGFHHREVFRGEEFPLPADDDLLARLREWENNLDPILEKQVREEMGLPPPPPPPTDLLDFAEENTSRSSRKGQKSQKRSGLFSSNDGYDSWEDNSNDWYGGDSSNEDSWSEELGNMWADDSSSSVWLAESGGSLTDDDSNVTHVDRGKENSPTEIWSLQAGNPSDSNNGEWLNAFDDQAASDWSDLEAKHVDDDDLAWWDDDQGDTSSVSSTAGMETPQQNVEREGDSLGAAIEVVSGAFKDFEGVVLEDSQDSNKVKAEVDVFGKPTIVFLGKKDFIYL